MKAQLPKTRRKPTILISIGAAILLLSMAFAGCQAEVPTEPEIAFEDLSPVYQSYAQIGRVQLIPPNLLAPILPENPTQADLGEQDYYQICLACHGNWGQGLTDEWRETGFTDDANCWESKCHAANHPAHGFEIPREMPPILGRGSLPGINNAEELYQVILETMPWWDPGQLSEEQSLNLTAYLLEARGELPEGVVLTTANLSAFTMHAPAPEITDPKMGGIVLIFGLSLSMAAYIWTRQTSDTEEDNQP